MRSPIPRALLLASLLAAPAWGGDAPPPAPAAPFEECFLPKADLRVPEFLAARPDDDGRGIVVAVLDTGVDPGHPRLATTTTGEPKIVDLLDATDDGFVDTSLPVDAADGATTGATGRRLTLGGHMGGGKRAGLGRIDAENVLPEDLAARLRRERRQRLDEAVRRAKEAGAPESAARAGETEDATKARRAAEHDARGKLADDTPAWDVLVVERDDGWRVVIDTDADGDLAEETPLRDYATAREWVTLRDGAELNVGVRPDPDGKRVRLLFDGNGHGTHVAGIVAGSDGGGCTLSGLAPGARILSIKIGNSRYGGPTTNLSILRALEWAGQRGAHVVNLSFGGPTFAGDAGSPDARAAEAAVERHGLLCCFSAGNDGPAMSTVGSPATARRVVSVGAFVSPGTMKASYAQLGPDPGDRLFGFSSRGPLPGGDLGVTVVAPGAAWSPLPAWRLVKAENWNGTSMAAPQVSGAAALLLCAAKRAGVPASPARVIRAITATARPVEGLLPFEQGAGLVQTDRAFDALVRMKDAPEERELRARVVNPTGVGGGVYLRPCLAEGPVDREVSVSVVWPEGTPNEPRVAYERRLVLEADKPWIQVPARLGVNAGGGSFWVRVDAAGLPPGVHSGLVRAMDPTRPQDGPELVVPVTVVRPHRIAAGGLWREDVALAPGERASRFVLVPHGAGRARLRVTAVAGGPRNQLSLALASLDAWRNQDDRLVERRCRLAAGDEQEVEAPVLEGTVLEIALFSHWERNVSATWSLDLRLEGPVSPDGVVDVEPGVDVALVRVASPLAAFQGTVSARLDETVERPEVAREVVPEGTGVLGGDRIHVARQRFPVKLAADERVRVVPTGSSALDEQREDARWRVVDAAGRIVRSEVVDGPFALDGLPAGTYAIEYETPTWGRAAADTGTTGFEVRRRREDAKASVFPTADLAADNRGGDAALELPPGSVRSVALRLPGLEAGRLHAGVIEVRDERDRVRLSLPLRVDRRTDPPSRDVPAAEAALVTAHSADALRVAGEPLAPEADRRQALERARRAVALRPGDRDVELTALRLEASLAATPEARAEAWKQADALLSRFDRENAGDRASVGRLLLLRSAQKRAAGHGAGAATDLAEARFLLPEGDLDLLEDRVARGRAEGGDRRDALAAARTVAERHPTSFAAAVRVVDLLLDLSWGIPAATEVRSFSARFPREAPAIRALAVRVRAAGGDPAPRTFESLDRAAP